MRNIKIIFSCSVSQIWALAVQGSNALRVTFANLLHNSSTFHGSPEFCPIHGPGPWPRAVKTSRYKQVHSYSLLNIISRNWSLLKRKGMERCYLNTRIPMRYICSQSFLYKWEKFWFGCLWSGERWGHYLRSSLSFSKSHNECDGLNLQHPPKDSMLKAWSPATDVWWWQPDGSGAWWKEFRSLGTERG